MATIIDELVVTLGLDPSAFVQGGATVRREMQSLHDLARQSVGATNVQQANLKRQFEDLAKTTGVAKEQVNNLWTDMRRNSIAAASAVDVTTTSMRNLVSAGLSALAAFEAVKGVVKDVAQTLASTERASFSAQTAGLRAERVMRFSSAAYRETGTAPEQTMGWLENLRQEVLKFQLPEAQGGGQRNAIIDQLIKLGIDPINTRPEDLPYVIADKLQGRRPDEAQVIAGGLGAPRSLTPFLRQGSSAIRAQEQLVGGPTEKEIEKTHELETAVRGVETQWTNVVRTLTIGMSGAMRDLLLQTEEYLKKLNESKERMDALQGSVTKIPTTAAAGGILGWFKGLFTGNLGIVSGLTGALRGFVLGIIADFLSTPGTSLVPRFGTPQEQEEYRRRKEEETNQIGQQGGILGNAWGRVKRWWNRDPNEQYAPIPPARGGSGKQGAAGGGYSLGQMKTLALNAGFKGQDADMMAALAMVESSGNPNAEGGVGELGLTQINPHAWGQDLANQARDPKRAFEIAHGIYGKQGWDAWKNSIPGAQAYLSRGNIQAEPLPGDSKLARGQRITQYAIPGREESVNNANPEFARRLSSLFEAMPADLQGGIKINNAFRSIETQRRLYAASHGSGMVAPPGGSMHNYGLAADLGGSDLARKGDALAWVHAHASEFGLQFPMQNEPWHIEPAELRSLGREGFLQKYGAAAASAQAPTPAAAETQSRHPLNRGFLVPPDTKFNSQGQPYASDLGTMSAEDKARVEQSMAAIRAGQKSGKPWYSEPHEAAAIARQTSRGVGIIGSAHAETPKSNVTNDTDVNVNNINIHTQATDASGVARHLTSAIRQQLATTHANAGLE